MKLQVRYTQKAWCTVMRLQWLMAVVIIAVYIGYTYSNAHDMMKRQVTRLYTVIAPKIAADLERQNLEQLEKDIRAFVQTTPIAGVRLTSERIAHSLFLGTFHPLRYDFSIMKDDSHLGSLTVYAWDTLIKSYIRASLPTILTIILIFFLITHYIKYLIYCRVEQPLQQIKETATQLNTFTYDKIVLQKNAATSVRMVSHVFNLRIQELADFNSQRQEKKHLISKIADTMSFMVIVLDSQGTIMHWNNKCAVFTHLSSEKAIGRNIQDVFPSFIPYFKFMRISLEKNKKLIFRDQSYVEDNKSYHHDVICYPMKDNFYHGGILVIDDITTTLKVKHMVEQQEINSVSGLASSVAREIQEPLTCIERDIQSALIHLDAVSERNQRIAAHIGVDLNKICGYFDKRNIVIFCRGALEAVVRLKNIVTNLLQFNLKSKLNKEKVNIVTLVDKVITQIPAYKKRTLVFQYQYDEHIPLISGVVNELEIVVYNILENAMQALETVEKPIIRVKIHTDDQGVKMIFANNGLAIPKEAATRIFEPFFTTKDLGDGIGLGLTVAYNIIAHHHQGQILYQGQHDNFTIFEIRLPQDKAEFQV